MEHASDKWSIAVFVLILSAIILYKIVTAQRGRVPSIRRIPGLNAIDEAIGRATEMGRPVLMVPGLGGLDVITLQALNIFSYIARSVARFGNRCILPTADPALTGVAEETLREAYQSAGRPELFDGDDVRFLSGAQFAFASGVAGIIHRERVAASFMMGSFFAESLILAENGQQAGAIQIAGTPSTTQLPFFIASCDYVLLGDEYYAASAYISRNPTLLGSIVGQDYCKLLMICVVLVGMLFATIMQFTGPGRVGHIMNYFVSLFSQ